MSDAFLDKFIADLVKGASSNLRENGGPGVNIVVDKENRGYEEKLANYAGAGALIGGIPGSLPADISHLGTAGMAVGAGLGADPGHGLQAALGAGTGHYLGDLVGGVAGRALGLQPSMVANLEKGLGLAGGAVGGQLGGKDRRGLMDRVTGKFGALEQRYDEGAKAAAAALGIKEASGILGSLVGQVAGPALARAGVSRLAGGAGGKALSGVAGKMLPHIGGGMGGMAFDTAAGMAGGAIGNKLQGAPPQV